MRSTIGDEDADISWLVVIWRVAGTGGRLDGMDSSFSYCCRRALLQALVCTYDALVYTTRLLGWLCEEPGYGLTSMSWKLDGCLVGEMNKGLDKVKLHRYSAVS